MARSFYETEAQSRQREKLEERNRQITMDMATLLAMPEGRRFFTLYLKKLGLARTLGNDPGEIAERNHAVDLLQEIARVNGHAAIEIMGAVYGLSTDFIKKDDPNGRSRSDSE